MVLFYFPIRNNRFGFIEKRRKMKFEELPNELLFNIFEFLNIIDLFHAFHGLNYRLDKLLFNDQQKYHLDS